MGPALGEVNAVAAHGGDSGLDDVVGHLVDGPIGVDDDEALGLGLSQDEELLAQGGAEGVPLLLEAVLGAATSPCGPPRASCRT